MIKIIKIVKNKKAFINDKKRNKNFQWKKKKIINKILLKKQKKPIK